MKAMRVAARILTVVGAFLLLGNERATAADVTATWLGGNGSWLDATKWSSNPLVPNDGNGGFTFDAVFPVTAVAVPSHVITTSQDIAVQQLLLQGSFFRLESTASNMLTVHDTFQLKGTLVNWGRVTAKGALLMEPRTFPGIETAIVNTTLDIEGTATWAAGEFQTASATVNIAPAAILDIQGDVLFDRDGASFETSILNNAGLIKKSGGAGTARMTQDLMNTGTVEVQSGTLHLERGSNTGTIRALPGAKVLFDGGGYNLGGTFDAHTLRVAGGVTVQPGTVFQNVQAIEVHEGGLTINRGIPTTVSSLFIDGLYASFEGIVTTGDQITVTGNTLLQGGKLTGGGQLVANGPTTIETVQFQLNQFSLNLNAASLLRTKLENFNSTIELAPTATLDIENDSDIQGGTFTNAGTLRKTTGSGESEISSKITHTGSIQVLNGTLELSGVSGGSTFAGPISGNAGAVIDFVNGTSTLLSGSSIDTIDATVTDFGSLRVDTNAHVTVKSIKLTSASGGNLDLRTGSELTLTDGLIIENGSLSGTGTLIGNINSSGTITPGTPNNRATLIIDGDLDQSATGQYLANIQRSQTLGLLSDLLDVSGDASIAGEIRITASGSLLDGDQFTILLADQIVNGGFTLTQPTLGSGRSITWAIQPMADRQGLVLTVVPEPSTFGYVLACLALARCRRRRLD